MDFIIPISLKKISYLSDSDLIASNQLKSPHLKSHISFLFSFSPSKTKSLVFKFKAKKNLQIGSLHCPSKKVRKMAEAREAMNLVCMFTFVCQELRFSIRHFMSVCNVFWGFARKKPSPNSFSLLLAIYCFEWNRIYLHNRLMHSYKALFGEQTGECWAKLKKRY